MTSPSVVYWERHWHDTRPATQAQWRCLTDLAGRPSHDYLYGYESMVHEFSETWRLMYDEAEGGDLADWLEHGPFNAMRYYVTDNGRP